MRLYSFINAYLSSIQQGIQTAHLVHELFNKYKSPIGPASKMVREWSKNHKTIIVCNGGTSAELKNLYTFFTETSPERFKLPLASFREDVPSLNGALTCVGLVVPRCYYDVEFIAKNITSRYTSRYYQTFQDHFYHPGTVQYEFCKRLKSYNLAR